jgi:NADH-quinone oxidoreductase subunit H
MGLCNFLTKAVLGVTCMIWLRWTLPRLRIDQVMTTCLKYCVPLASAMLAGAMVWTYLVPEGLAVHIFRILGVM